MAIHFLKLLRFLIVLVWGFLVKFIVQIRASIELNQKIKEAIEANKAQLDPKLSDEILKIVQSENFEEIGDSLFSVGYGDPLLSAGGVVLIVGFLFFLILDK